jgi:hypothetical protein
MINYTIGSCHTLSGLDYEERLSEEYGGKADSNY